MHIRRARPEDAPALSAIVQGAEAYRGEYRAMLDGYAIDAGQIVRDEMHLVEESGGVLGFYGLVFDEPPELDLLFVADAAQGRGLGRLLFDHMRTLAASRGVTAVKIVSHPPAADFYRRMGAIDAGYAYPAGRISWTRPIFILPVSPSSA